MHFWIYLISTIYPTLTFGSKKLRYTSVVVWRRKQTNLRIIEAIYLCETTSIMQTREVLMGADEKYWNKRIRRKFDQSPELHELLGCCHLHRMMSKLSGEPLITKHQYYLRRVGHPRLVQYHSKSVRTARLILSSKHLMTHSLEVLLNKKFAN